MFMYIYIYLFFFCYEKHNINWVLQFIPQIKQIKYYLCVTNKCVPADKFKHIKDIFYLQHETNCEIGPEKSLKFLIDSMLTSISFNCLHYLLVEFLFSNFTVFFSEIRYNTVRPHMYVVEQLKSEVGIKFDHCDSECYETMYEIKKMS